MTCFWDSIVSSLNHDDFIFLGADNFNINKQSVIGFLKSNNTAVKDVLWQNSKLRKQEINEHIEAINSYDIKGIYSGHLTSCCDSFLLLLCQLFNLTIHHTYMGHLIVYKSSNGERRVIKFKSNKRHFQKC